MTHACLLFIVLLACSPAALSRLYYPFIVIEVGNFAPMSISSSSAPSNSTGTGDHAQDIEDDEIEMAERQGPPLSDMELALFQQHVNREQLLQEREAMVADLIAAIPPRHENARTLGLNTRQIDDIRLMTLFEYLLNQDILQFEIVDVSNNQITDAGAATLAYLIRNLGLENMRELNLAGNSISPAGIAVLQEAIRQALYRWDVTLIR